MRASRGMGSILPSKMPKAKKAKRRDDADTFIQYAEGGMVSGLYANIHKKRERIAAGSGEKMRKPGAKGAPKEEAFKKAARTAKK
jgi:hypothetical protein